MATIDSKRLGALESRLGTKLPADFVAGLAKRKPIREGKVVLVAPDRVWDVRTTFTLGGGKKADQLDRLYELVGDVLPPRIGAITLTASCCPVLTPDRLCGGITKETREIIASSLSPRQSWNSMMGWSQTRAISLRIDGDTSGRVYRASAIARKPAARSANFPLPVVSSSEADCSLLGLTPMLHYPKIPCSQNAPAGRCIAFEKCDGTNLHWDWHRDFAWHSFGTRRDEFNLTGIGLKRFFQAHAELRQCVEVFWKTLAEPVEKILRDHPNYKDFPSLKIFTEFLGPNSFAGRHKEDDPKELRLFDVWAEPPGMISPKQFVADFGDLQIARVVYTGSLTGKFADDVREGKYGVAEGVVCKGGLDGNVWMVKIKTYAYQERLKKAFAERWEEYWE